MRTVMIAVFVIPMIIASGIWLWIRHERGKIRDRGVSACVATGRTSAACNEMADRNHERCMELTFRAGGRFSGSSFDERGYVECIEIGEGAYWKLSAQRAADRSTRR